MKTVQILPVVLILIDLGAAIGYFIAGDWKRGIYWIAAATLTATVTF